MKLSNVFQIVSNILKTFDELNEEQQKVLGEFLLKYSARDIIYPRVISQKTRLDMSIIYKILDALGEKNIVEKNYEFYCHNCGKFCGEIYETINSIPEDIYCEDCCEKLNFMYNAIIIYRVLQNVK